MAEGKIDGTYDVFDVDEIRISLSVAWQGSVYHLFQSVNNPSVRTKDLSQPEDAYLDGCGTAALKSLFCL
jgi:hypothetical protein